MGKPKVDWEARVGSYTYDQAVLEMGPPDKSADLSDGGLVVEWVTRQGHYTEYSSMGGYYGGYYPYYGYPGWMPGPNYIHKTPDRYLRLIFSSERVLTGYSVFRK